MLSFEQHTCAARRNIYLQHRSVNEFKPTEIKSNKNSFKGVPYFGDSNSLTKVCFCNRNCHHSTNNLRTKPRDLLLRSNIARLTGACFRALRHARTIKLSLMAHASRTPLSGRVLSGYRESAAETAFSSDCHTII